MIKEKKEKIYFLDIYRFLCIFAVISIHVTSDPVSKIPVNTWPYFVYYIINIGSSFAVPAFLFLSAFVLFYNYEDRWNIKMTKSFFYKRFISTIIPYIIWSFFYYAVLQVSLGQNIFNEINKFLIQLFTGKNYAHLYYIIVIAQFYLLFPVLMGLVKKFPYFRKYLVQFSIIFQIVFFLLNKYFLHIKATGSIFFTYMLFYCVGAYIGLNYQALKNYLTKKPLRWIIAWIIIGIFYIAKGWYGIQNPGCGQPLIAYLNFIIYYLYVTISSLAIFVISNILYVRWGEKVKILSQWGRASFLIYLLHPFVLLCWRHYIIANNSNLYHLLTILAVPMALLVPWIVFLCFNKYKFAWLFMGNVEAKKQIVKK